MKALINYLDDEIYIVDDIPEELFNIIASYWPAKPIEEATEEELELAEKTDPKFLDMFQDGFFYDIEPASVLPAFRLLAKGKITCEECAELVNLEEISKKAINEYLDELCIDNADRNFNEYWIETFSEIREKNKRKQRQFKELVAEYKN